MQPCITRNGAFTSIGPVKSARVPLQLFRRSHSRVVCANGTSSNASHACSASRRDALLALPSAALIWGLASASATLAAAAMPAAALAAAAGPRLPSDACRQALDKAVAKTITKQKVCLVSQ